MKTDRLPCSACTDCFIRQRFRKLRQMSGLTQQELTTRALRCLQWNRDTVNAIERGSRRLKSGELILMPWLFGITLTDFLSGLDSVHCSRG